jgi:hypothetical protein
MGPFFSLEGKFSWSHLVTWEVHVSNNYLLWGSHYRSDALTEFFRPCLPEPKLYQAIQEVTQRCQLCAKNNLKTQKLPETQGTQCCETYLWRLTSGLPTDSKGCWKLQICTSFCWHQFPLACMVTQQPLLCVLWSLSDNCGIISPGEQATLQVLKTEYFKDVKDPSFKLPICVHG